MIKEKSSRMGEALRYAAEVHGDAVRTGTSIPYLSHPLAVASLVMEYGGDEDMAIAAVLHDVAEDEGGISRIREIEERFGRRVADLVASLSDDLPDAKENKRPWRPRKEEYLKHLAQAQSDNLLISACDKLHNARAILRDFKEVDDKLWERFSGGKEGTLWYYQTLVEIFKTKNLPPGLISELKNTVREILTLAK